MPKLFTAPSFLTRRPVNIMHFFAIAVWIAFTVITIRFGNCSKIAGGTGYRTNSLTPKKPVTNNSNSLGNNNNFNAGDFSLSFLTTTQVNVSVRTGSAQSAGTDAQVYIDFELLPLIVAPSSSSSSQQQQQQQKGVSKRNSGSTSPACARTGHQWGLCMSSLQSNETTTATPRRDTFEPNNVDTFTVYCPALSDIRRVRLFNFGNDGWLVSDLNITYSPISIPEQQQHQRPLQADNNNNNRKLNNNSSSGNALRRRSAIQRFMLLRFACNMWLDPDSVEHNKRGYGDCRLVASSSSTSPLSASGENSSSTPQNSSVNKHATTKFQASPNVNVGPTQSTDFVSSASLLPIANNNTTADTKVLTTTLHNTVQAWVDFGYAATINNNNATTSPNDVNIFDTSTETSEASAVQPYTSEPGLSPTTATIFDRNVTNAPI